MLNGNVSSQVGANISTVWTVWAGKGLFPSVNYEMAAEAELVLVTSEDLATDRASSTPFHGAQRRPSQGRTQPTQTRAGSTYAPLEQHH